MTIDYKNPQKFTRSVGELTEFLLWTTVTPGKKSSTITPRFNKLVEEEPATSVIRSHGNRIRSLLKKNGIGQYERLIKCWQTIGFGELDGTRIRSGDFLRNATREQLTIIPGLGLKTASFFMVNTRPWAEVAVLDVHILRWLAREFPKYPVPEQTPQDPDEYARLEAMFLGASCKFNMSPADLDIELWKEAAAA